MLKFDLRATSDDPGDMDTDDEHDPSLSQAILSAISGVNIAVLDANGDALEPTIEETERDVLKETLEDLWVELQTRGGNPEADIWIEACHLPSICLGESMCESVAIVLLRFRCLLPFYSGLPCYYVR